MKPVNVSALSSPENLYAAYCGSFCSVFASSKLRTGIICLQPLANAVTMDVVAIKISRTITTLSCRFSFFNSDLFVSTCNFFIMISLSYGAFFEHNPCLKRGCQFILLIDATPAGIHHP